jgi:hypothetical protein
MLSIDVMDRRSFNTKTTSLFQRGDVAYVQQEGKKELGTLEIYLPFKDQLLLEYWSQSINGRRHIALFRVSSRKLSLLFAGGSASIYFWAGNQAKTQPHLNLSNLWNACTPFLVQPLNDLDPGYLAN